MQKYTVVELFAGAGGLALGLENSGLKTIYLNDNIKDCTDTLKLNRPNWEIVCEDIHKIDFSKIKADVVTGGFPCQAFSYAGKKLGFKDTRGTLFFEFARAVKEIDPQIFVAENVAALKTHDKGRTLQTMLDVLRNDLKYNVEEPHVLDASYFGVPQKRKRIIIVGTKPGIKFEYPKPSDKQSIIKDFLKNVPKSPGYEFTGRRKEILSKVPPGGCWVNLPKELQMEYMGKSFTSGGGRRGMARRISWDEPSLTLTTSPHQKQTDRIHPSETRPFTVREYARIQTFPDDWQFSGGTSAQYKQIGNAVPVKLAEAIGKQIIKSLDNKT